MRPLPAGTGCLCHHTSGYWATLPLQFCMIFQEPKFQCCGLWAPCFMVKRFGLYWGWEGGELTPWHTDSAGSGSPCILLPQRSFLKSLNLGHNLLAFKMPNINCIHFAGISLKFIKQPCFIVKNSVNNWRHWTEARERM